MRRPWKLAAMLAVLLTPETGRALPGDLDPSFGRGGRAFGDVEVSLIRRQSDGKLLKGDSFHRDDLQRLFPDGTLDSAFVSALPTLGLQGEDIRGLAVQPDGAVLVTGFVLSTGFALARLLADGSLDPSFGTGGVVSTPPAPEFFGLDLVLQADGAILVGGLARPTPGHNEFAVARYDSSGVLDPTFGTGGVVITDAAAPSGSNVSALAVQSDGKIVAAGTPYIVARYDATGVLDPTFGSGGLASLPGGVNPSAMIVQPDGAIVATGLAGTARLLSTGALDPSFGVGGMIATGGTELLRQADGKLVLSTSGVTDPVDRVLADGTTDATFVGDASRVMLGGASCQVLDPEGRFVCSNGLGVVRILGGTCGNGTLEAGEDCDDGNTVGGDGCSASCCVADADGDGRCDAIDWCTGGSAFVKTSVKIQKRGTGERMAIKGEAPIAVPPIPPLDLAANGLRLRIDGTSGNLMDFTAAGGAGWTVAGGPGRPPKWTWDPRSAPPFPLRLGFTLIKVQDRTNRTPPTLKFDVRALDEFAFYQLDQVRNPANQPISVTLTFSGPTSPSGQCGTATFPGPPPAPNCTVTQGTKLVCK